MPSTEKPQETQKPSTGYKADDATPKEEEKKPDEGHKVDDYGYPVVDEKSKEEKPKEEEPKEEEPKEEEKPVELVTGYGDEPPKVKEEPKEEEPKEEEKPAESDEFKIAEPGDLLTEEVAELESFIKTHKVGKELAEALVEKKKADVAKLKKYTEDQEKERERQTALTKAQWHKELKEDSTFGGEKFEFNIKRAEKVIEDHMPNLKKRLTESGTMLPPYVMRDLATLAGHLYSTPKLAQGEPSGPSAEEKAKEEDDPLAFYNS